MNATETLNRVLATLGLKPEEAIVVDLAQVKTEDGQATFESDNFAIGEAVFIVTPDGNIPCPEGEFALENGNTMTVDANGTIIEVATKEEEAPEEEPMVEEVVAEDQPMKDQIAESMPMAKKVVKSKTEMEESYFSKQMSELEAKFEARLSALEMEKMELSAENKELTERLATEPAPHTLHNPEANSSKKLQFHIGNKRAETITDRVFNQLFN